MIGWKLAGEAAADALSLVPRWVWAALAVLALLIGVHHAGVVSGRAQVQVRFDKYKAAQIAAVAKANVEARAKESAQREAFAQINAQHQKDLAHAIAKERAVADAVRRGALRLRQHWTCPVRPAEGPAVAGGGDEGAELRAEAAGRIVRIGAEADAQVKALQDLLRAEREK